MKSSDITQIIYDLYPIKWTILGIRKIYDMLNDSEHVFQILYVSLISDHNKLIDKIPSQMIL